MPKLYFYFGLMVFFYSNEHEPIHVHGFYQGREGKAELTVHNGKVVKITFTPVAEMPPLRSAELARFKKLVRAKADEIVQKWIDYFVLHRNITPRYDYAPIAMIAIAEKTVHVQAVHHVRAYRLRIEFSDGQTREVDFEPFLRFATHPGIRRYLQPRRFKQFAITDGVLQWNDFDLVFPMADLYDGVIRWQRRR